MGTTTGFAHCQAAQGSVPQPNLQQNYQGAIPQQNHWQIPI